MKYKVLMSEIHSVWYYVDADSEEQAQIDVENGVYDDMEDQGCEMGGQTYCLTEEDN